MILAGQQPNLLPWLGYFYKIQKADIFRISDYVKYTKQSFINRTLIRTLKGEKTWITIPVVREDINKSINEVRINRQGSWKNKLIDTIKANYSRTNRLDEISEVFKIIRNYEGDYLSELNILLIRQIVDILKIKTEIIIGSNLSLAKGKSEHIIDSCQKLACEKYLSGTGANYYDFELFNKNMIEIIKSDFSHPVYPQTSSGFISGLSVIDAILNVGVEKTKEFIHAK